MLLTEPTLAHCALGQHCLDGAWPLSEPMLTYCQADCKEHISIKFYLKFKYFHSRKSVWTCRLWNGGHFVSASMSYHAICWLGGPRWCPHDIMKLWSKLIQVIAPSHYLNLDVPPKRLVQWHSDEVTQIAKFMGPTWGPPGSWRPQMGPMLAPWTLLSG